VFLHNIIQETAKRYPNQVMIYNSHNTSDYCYCWDVILKTNIQTKWVNITSKFKTTVQS